MKKNVGITDRIIRLVIAVVIAILFFTKVLTGTLGIVLLIIAGILLITGLMGSCLLYLPFGLNTAGKKKK